MDLTVHHPRFHPRLSSPSLTHRARHLILPPGHLARHLIHTPATKESPLWILDPRSLNLASLTLRHPLRADMPDRPPNGTPPPDGPEPHPYPIPLNPGDRP